MMKYIKILLSYFWGLMYMLLLYVLPKKKLRGAEESHPQVVITLTSYGRRARKVVPHTIASLLFQRRMPDRIIVWLDEKEFTEGTLPKSLIRLRDKYGVEIRFCANTRSYKKLVPSLQLCPEDILITVDDDFVYRRSLIDELLKANEQYPHTVLCTLAHSPLFTKKGAVLPYDAWEQNVNYQDDNRPVFPLGGSGTLYPPHTLHKDVSNIPLFTQLSPYADDVWFWAMAVCAGTQQRLINVRRCFYPIDLYYQLRHKHNSLMDVNVRENQNDMQIKAVMGHYGITYDSTSKCFVNSLSKS